MNVGITPCFTPTLLATSLNNTPLSAMRDASVYAKAVSKTPGPVSVSEWHEHGNASSSRGMIHDAPPPRCQSLQPRRISRENSRHSMSAEAGSTHALGSDVKVSQQRVLIDLLPGVRGARFVYRFSTSDWGVSANWKYCESYEGSPSVSVPMNSIRMCEPRIQRRSCISTPFAKHVPRPFRARCEGPPRAVHQSLGR